MDTDTTLLEDVVDELPTGRALDLATGDGRAVELLADRGLTVDAIDISQAMLDRARERTTTRSAAGTINWILADIDSYCFPTGVYDVISIRFFDARDQLAAIRRALSPSGVLVYEHRLQPAGAENPYRFEPNELLAACSDLQVSYYDEDRDRSLVRLVASAPASAEFWKPGETHEH